MTDVPAPESFDVKMARLRKKRKSKASGVSPAEVHDCTHEPYHQLQRRQKLMGVATHKHKGSVAYLQDDFDDIRYNNHFEMQTGRSQAVQSKRQRFRWPAVVVRPTLELPRISMMKPAFGVLAFAYERWPEITRKRVAHVFQQRYVFGSDTAFAGDGSRLFLDLDFKARDMTTFTHERVLAFLRDFHERVVVPHFPGRSDFGSIWVLESEVRFDEKADDVSRHGMKKKGYHVVYEDVFVGVEQGRHLMHEARTLCTDEELRAGVDAACYRSATATLRPVYSSKFVDCGCVGGSTHKCTECVDGKISTSFYVATARVDTSHKDGFFVHAITTASQLTNFERAVAIAQATRIAPNHPGLHKTNGFEKTASCTEPVDRAYASTHAHDYKATDVTRHRRCFERKSSVHKKLVALLDWRKAVGREAVNLTGLVQGFGHRQWDRDTVKDVRIAPGLVVLRVTPSHVEAGRTMPWCHIKRGTHKSCGGFVAITKTTAVRRCYHPKCQGSVSLQNARQSTHARTLVMIRSWWKKPPRTLSK